MKIKITEDIKLAISPRENKQFLKGDEHDLPDIIVQRLIELKKAEILLEEKENKENIEDDKEEENKENVEDDKEEEKNKIKITKNR
tara:strand:+ start:330 stop:587 length:258 start_codon:yes stop_codon:yes gene_type:complete